MDKKALLTPFEKHVLEDKGTERPFSGEYTDKAEEGSYVCRNCSSPLFLSTHKFSSHCGWPSFDDEIEGALKRTIDEDGIRTEITCAACGAHLGHVFEGEGFTAKGVRHCVNSVSLVFKPTEKLEKKKALFASGCFWGTEYYFAKASGVLSTEVGYAGGTLEQPSYEAVCKGNTGHLECVEVTYDPRRTNFETLAKLFFETHDFSQEDGQGPDIGAQYLSAIFVRDDDERKIAEDLVARLRSKGHFVATQIRPKATFWKAENYHQKYYFRNAKTPYCHVYRKIF